MKRILLAVLICLFTAGLAFAQEKGAAKEAQNMVDKAIAFYKANGAEKALAEISNPAGQFIKGNVYVFIWGTDYVVKAHPTNTKLIGKSMKDLKDTDGKQFVFDGVELAKAKGSGWVDYKYTNPVSKKIEAKTTYVKKVDDLVFVCGIYK
ncbi:MAG: hypothetical protein CVU52_02760 [Deltaproteobacteria bacterium HGW-Deltaproteobacteria-10]|nr:MAG: hypothetical protein CVU52_02760 [Deltaproteobacteria bacterium HGW-Deltaproteobacteria-10]